MCPATRELGDNSSGRRRFSARPRSRTRHSSAKRWITFGCASQTPPPLSFACCSCENALDVCHDRPAADGGRDPRRGARAVQPEVGRAARAPLRLRLGDREDVHGGTDVDGRGRDSHAHAMSHHCDEHLSAVASSGRGCFHQLQARDAVFKAAVAPPTSAPTLAAPPFPLHATLPETTNAN